MKSSMFSVMFNKLSKDCVVWKLWLLLLSSTLVKTDWCVGVGVCGCGCVRACMWVWMYVSMHWYDNHGSPHQVPADPQSWVLVNGQPSMRSPNIHSLASSTQQCISVLNYWIILQHALSWRRGIENRYYLGSVLNPWPSDHGLGSTVTIPLLNPTTVAGCGLYLVGLHTHLGCALVPF